MQDKRKRRGYGTGVHHGPVRIGGPDARWPSATAPRCRDPSRRSCCCSPGGWSTCHCSLARAQPHSPPCPPHHRADDTTLTVQPFHRSGRYPLMRRERTQCVVIGTPPGSFRSVRFSHPSPARQRPPAVCSQPTATATKGKPRCPGTHLTAAQLPPGRTGSPTEPAAGTAPLETEKSEPTDAIGPGGGHAARCERTE